MYKIFFSVFCVFINFFFLDNTYAGIDGTSKLSTVKIVHLSGSGSGVIVSSDGRYILTNEHVISGYDRVKVCLTFDEKIEPTCEFSAKVINKNETYDLALLEITHAYFPDRALNDDYQYILLDQFSFIENITSYPFVKIDTTMIDENVSLGDDIFVLGYPSYGGETITLTKGIVSGFDRININNESIPSLIKTDAKLNPGNSGGGVFNENNDLIGISVAVFGGAGNIGYVISLPVINYFLANSNFYYESVDQCSDSGLFYVEARKGCMKKENLCIDIVNGYFSEKYQKCYCNMGYVWKNKTCQLDSHQYSSNYTFSVSVQTPIDPDIFICGENAHLVSNNMCECDTGYIFKDIKTSPNCILNKITVKNTIIETIDTNTSDTTDEIENSSFTDVSSSHNYFNGIEFVKSKGIVNGYDDGTFKPENKITRAEFTKIVIGSKYSTQEIGRAVSSDFEDVDQTQWFAPYVNLAKSEGIINGYPDNTFRPTQKISFAEAAKIIVNVLFTDIPEEDSSQEWWERFDTALRNKNSVPEDITSPSHPISRGEMAEIIYRLLK